MMTVLPQHASAGERCAQQSTPGTDRCLMVTLRPVTLGPVTVRPNAEPTASDFGPSYDAEGNPVDRHGNVIAVSQDRPGSARQVFASDR